MCLPRRSLARQRREARIWRVGGASAATRTMPPVDAAGVGETTLSPPLMQETGMPIPDETTIGALASVARIEIPEERRAAVAARLQELLDLAAELDALPLDGVPPAMRYDPSWTAEEGEDERAAG